MTDEYISVPGISRQGPPIKDVLIHRVPGICRYWQCHGFSRFLLDKGNCFTIPVKIAYPEIQDVNAPDAHTESEHDNGSITEFDRAGGFPPR